VTEEATFKTMPHENILVVFDLPQQLLVNFEEILDFVIQIEDIPVILATGEIHLR
jgi:hypothetical protein